jgi:hypothetical protein
MRKFLAIALLGLAFAAGPAQSKDKGCCVKVPKECFTYLRQVPGDPTPPDGPIPYSVWYYSLYEPFCKGKSEAACIWACAKALPKCDACGNVVKAGG